MVIKTVQPLLAKNRTQAFWYNGQVAYIKVKNGTYSLQAVGHIRVQFEKNGEIYTDYHAREEAFNRNLTDKDLNKIDSFDGWLNNNWFEVVFIPKNETKGIESGFGEIADTYQEGIEMLKQYVKEQVFEA